MKMSKFGEAVKVYHSYTSYWHLKIILVAQRKRNATNLDGIRDENLCLRGSMTFETGFIVSFNSL